MKTQFKVRSWPLIGLLLAATPLAPLGCGERRSELDKELTAPTGIALRGAVVWRDVELDRMVFLTAKKEPRWNEDGELEGDPAELLGLEAVPVGQDVTAVQTSRDLERLFVLSRGVFPRTREGDEPPQLLVLDGAAKSEREGRVVKRFELDDPMRELAIDPRGEWVAAFGGDAQVTNQNELVLFSLAGDDPEGRPATKTIRSFGGAPEELTFTDELSVPGGAKRRFLLVRTDRDVTLVDLSDLDASEVTIKLPEDAAGDALTPAALVNDEGDPEDTRDSRIAIRLDQSSDVVIAELGPPATDATDFSVVTNIVDVGGVPSAIDFVRTDGGLRLAALVPGARIATLVDPETTLAERVELPDGFTKMTRITSLVSEAPEDGDVALLWGETDQIAFWSLGSTSATPYRSIDATVPGAPVREVLDVPAPNARLKVLRIGGDDRFFVLDLEKRQTFPLNTEFYSAAVTVAADGERLWVYSQYDGAFSSVTLDDLHPQSLYVEPALLGVFDIERVEGDGRAAVVLHDGSDGAGWSATLLDAEDPDSTRSLYFPALQIGGLQ
jgi:hypothetical protein